MTLRLTDMGTSDRRDIARARALEVMRLVSDSIKADPKVNKTLAAESVGMAPSTFYRWLSDKPAKVDVIQLSALVDFLHDEYGYADFAALWRDVAARIK